MKNELEKKRRKKAQEKAERKQERKANATDGQLENKLVYVNEDGEIVSTPPEKKA